MTPIAAKLLMCVCAGSTGAVMVPATQKVRAAMKPRPAVHHVLASAPRPRAVPQVELVAAPCVPGVEGGVAVAGGGIGSPTDGGLLSTSNGAPGGFFGGGQGFDDDFVSGGFAGAPLGGGSAGGGLPAGTPVLAGLPAAAGTSPAPETATWTMMITGFGVVGGGMRWLRRPLVV